MSANLPQSLNASSALHRQGRLGTALSSAQPRAFLVTLATAGITVSAPDASATSPRTVPQTRRPLHRDRVLLLESP